MAKHVYRRPPDIRPYRPYPMDALFSIQAIVYQVLAQDGFYFYDGNTNKDRSLRVQDGMYMKDVIGKERELRMLDTVYVPDFPVKGQDKVMTDKFMFSDLAMEGIVRQLFTVDKLLLGDSGLRERLAQRLAQDGLYLSDVSVRDRAVRIVDNLLFNDYVYRALALYLLDKMYVVDSVLAQQPQNGTEYARAASDGLYLNDSRRSVLEKALLEAFFFKDSASRLTEKELLDNMLLRDSQFHETLMRVSEAFMLNDQARKETSKALVDNLLFRDTESHVRIVQLLMQDGLFVQDFQTRLKEMLIRENLSLVDSVNLALTQTLQAVISYMLVQALNPLGALPSFSHPLAMSASYRRQDS